MVSSQLTFLSYGTTARSARFYGAGDRTAAVGEGVQATWLALGLGLAIVAVVQVAAVPIVSAIAAGGDIAAAALPWVRIAIAGVPAILISAAGNGWMRGVQDTMRPLRYVLIGFGASAVLCPLLVYGWLGLPRLELAGSAVANLVGQWLAALLFCRALLVERVPLRLDLSVLRAQVVMGRDLVLRTMAFRPASSRPPRSPPVRRRGAGGPPGGAAVVEFPCAGAGFAGDRRAVTGRCRPRRGSDRARQIGRVAGDGVLDRRRFGARGGVRGRRLGAAVAVHRRPFGARRDGVPWWFMVAQLPIAGIVFALDGVLLGAGDAAFMRSATLVSALVGFLPLIWLSLVFGWGWSASGRA